MQENIKSIHQELLKAVTIAKERQSMFFKTAVGTYGAHDKFLGITVPNLRKIAKNFSAINLEELKLLIASEFNEERLLALIILTNQYAKGNAQTKEDIYQFYLENISQVNNWNLVDASAHLIIGAYLFDKDKNLLYELALSKDLWKRRIAIVATWYFIKNNVLEQTLEIAMLLLNDKEDLMHKAVGWMLREAGKKDEKILVGFLNQHGNNMPRTALRYAIEKFPKEQRKKYLTEFNKRR
jgi:3-methyladenine DNA glycosylase AlkD